MHSINLIIIGKCEDNMHIHTVHTGFLLPSYVMPWHSMCKLITKVERKMIFLEHERNIGNGQLKNQIDGVAIISPDILTIDIIWIILVRSPETSSEMFLLPSLRIALFLDGIKYYNIT